MSEWATMTEGRIEEFLYFDEEGIDMLFNQFSPDRLERYSKETSGNREKLVGARAKFNFGSLLARLGFPGLDAEAEGQTKRAVSDRRQDEFVPTKEGRYASLLAQLGGATLLKCTLNDALHRTLASSSTSFFIGEAAFLPETISSDNPDQWRVRANDCGVLRLREATDSQFTMGMSVAKLIGGRNGHISPTGHLAVRLRHGDVHLRIFGKMDRSKYIKPYVISW